VGVVSAVADEGDYDDTWYLPFAQGALGPSTETFHVMVRTAGDPVLVAPAMRPLVARLDSTLGVYDLAPMADVYGGGLAQERLGAVVLLMFGAFGVLLSSLGIYGTMSHAVQQRQGEIGIRMALGARPRDVLRDVVGRGARVAAVGIAIGLLASVAASSFLSRVLFETPALHAPTLLGVSASLGAVALLACLVPGLRALKVDPVTALR
jgi:ABC-type antimicrobial peptide transport system permease subunit